jgi:RNA polymerase sigma factor (sigma-70 family)
LPVIASNYSLTSFHPCNGTSRFSALKSELTAAGVRCQRCGCLADERIPAQYMMADDPDAELVRRAQAGELDAFEALTTRYEQRVFSLAMRMLRQEQDAEDVTQQTFLSALENLNGFRGEARFATWLLRIATHAALKVIRKHKGLKTVSLEEATEGTDRVDSVPQPEFIADWRQSPEQLAQKTRNPTVIGRGAGQTG